jgi:transglutaminase-like putative cysteine protease
MRTRTLTLAFSYTLGALTTGAVALAPLPDTGWVLLGVACAIGAALDRSATIRLPGPALTLAGLAGFLASLLPLHRETLAEQSLTALAFLLAVKIIGAKSRRDHLQILAVALLLISGAASLEPGLAFGALLLAALVTGVFQLLWLPFPEVTPTVGAGLVRRLTAIGLVLVAASVPLTLVLFLVLPRSVNPFWAGTAGRPRQGVSGISDHLELGDVGRVAISGAVAFRAEIEDGPLPTTPYWRGAVLEMTDGRRWDVSGRSRPAATPTDGRGTSVLYYVEPHGVRQLFVLETPAEAVIGARSQRLGAARVLQLSLPLARRIRYQARSVLADRFTERLPPDERVLNLRLPESTPESIRALAASVAAGGDPEAVVARMLSHFTRGYTYSLSVPAADGDPLEAFLLGHRTGYCEYFASGLAVMLRAAGVPARVVSGYIGGTWVPGGSYYLVTQSSAHAWVEAYVDGAWIRLDPTPAAAAFQRAGAGRRAATARLWLDTLRMRWNSWVIQYDAESQLSLARAGASRIRNLSLDPRPVARAGAAALGAAALLWAAVALLRRRVRDPLARRIARYERLASGCGAARRHDEGPLDHAARFAASAPAAGEAVRRFGAAAAACRYGGRPADGTALAELDALLRAIRAACRGSGSAEARALARPEAGP